MKYLGEILAFFFMFVFVVLLTPTLVQKTTSPVAAGFGDVAVLIPWMPWIVLGSLIGLFAVVIAKRRMD